MKLQALSLLALAAVFAGCSSDITDEQSATNQKYPEAINATIENAQMDAQSRATFASDASFIWTSGDHIGVSQTNGSTTSFSTFKLSKGAGTAKATFIGSLNSGYTIGNKLVYPKSAVSSLSGTTLTISLPAEYEYAYETESFGTTTGDINSANMPMLANYTGSGVEFKHLGGYFVFEISKIPAGCNKFEFEAVNNKKLSGTFSVNTSASEPSYSTSTSASANKITITFPETTAESKRLFVIPVPVGSYAYEWNIYNTSGDIKGFGASDDAISVSRGQIKAKRLECASISTGDDDTGGSTSNMVNGHEYVDLGLSVKWATMNVGATEVAGTKKNSHTGEKDCYGEYYAWGETSPKDSYTWSNLKYCSGTTYKGPFTKYVASSTFGTVDNKTTLELTDDAARENWGGTWRMPTITEQQELIDNCYWEWTTSYNGVSVNGYIVYKAKSDSDKGKKKYSGISTTTAGSYSLSDPHIFLPAAGYRGDTSLYNVGANSYYRSSSLNTSYSNYAYYVYFYSSNVGWKDSYRYYGRSVRAVCP